MDWHKARVGKKPSSDCLGQVNFALVQVKMEVWRSDMQVKLASVVLLVTIFNQTHFQNLRLQDEQNNKLTAWINLKRKQNSLAFVLGYSLSQIIDSIY